MRKNRPLGPLEFVLICVIIALTALVGMQVVFGRLVRRSSAAPQPFVAQLIPSAVSTETPRPTVTPLGRMLPTQDLPATWTPTHTWTPRPTRTHTPASAPTPTAAGDSPIATVAGRGPTTCASAGDDTLRAKVASPRYAAASE